MASPIRRLAAGQFFGTLLGKREVSGIVLTEYEYARDQVIEPHAHEAAYACVVLDGVHTERVGRTTRTHEPMTVTFHPAGELHADQFHAGPARIFSAEVPDRWLVGSGGRRDLFAEPGYHRGGSVAATMVRMFREFRIDDAASDLMVESCLLELVGIGIRARAATGPAYAPPWLRRARELALDSFSERVSLASIAREVGVHPTHLVREFRRHYGETIGDCVRRRRVERACELVSSTALSLSAVAAECGFAQQSHFSKLFRLHTGLTPSQYRRRTSRRLG